MSLEDEKAAVAAVTAAAFFDGPVAVETPETDDVAPVQGEQQTVPAAAEQPQTAEVDAPDEPEFPQFSYIETDDDEDDEDDTPVAAGATDSDDEFEEYDEDATRAALEKARKEAAHYKGQALAAKRSQWVGKMRDRYPLADFDDIRAESRRAFEKAAVSSHNANFKKLEPHLTKLQTAYAEIKGEAKAEAKAEASQAWGTPVAGPDVQTIDVAVANAEIDAERQKARSSGDLSNLFKKMIQLGK